MTLTSLPRRMRAFGVLHLLERSERRLGAPLLVEAEDRVEDDDEEDRGRVAEAHEDWLLGVADAVDDRDDRCHEQRDDDGVRELREELDQQALADGSGQLVQPIPGEALCCQLRLRSVRAPGPCRPRRGAHRKARGGVNERNGASFPAEAGRQQNTNVVVTQGAGEPAYLLGSSACPALPYLNLRRMLRAASRFHPAKPRNIAARTADHRALSGCSASMRSHARPTADADAPVPAPAPLASSIALARPRCLGPAASSRTRRPVNVLGGSQRPFSCPAGTLTSTHTSRLPDDRHRPEPNPR